jgi:hypothetical protein
MSLPFVEPNEKQRDANVAAKTSQHGHSSLLNTSERGAAVLGNERLSVFAAHQSPKILQVGVIRNEEEVEKSKICDFSRVSALAATDQFTSVIRAVFDRELAVPLDRETLSQELAKAI